MINTESEGSGTMIASEVMLGILEVCGSLNLGKNTWYATLLESEPVLIQGKKGSTFGLYVKPIGIRIERQKTHAVPQTRFQKMKQDLKDALEPAIIINPLFEHARVRNIKIDLVVGEHVFSDPSDTMLTIPFRKDLEQIFKLLKESLSQEFHYRT